MLISFLLLFFPNLAGNVAAADFPISIRTNLFTDTLKLDFFVVVQLLSLFLHLLGRAQKAETFVYRTNVFSDCQKFRKVFWMP